MDARRKVLSVLMAVVMVVGLCPMAAYADGDLVAAGLVLSTQTAGKDDYPAAYKNANKDTVVDSWGFNNRACTSFVAWRLNNDNGILFTNAFRGAQWGNAKTWGDAAKSVGIAVDATPAVGSVAWWSTGETGRVAWVQAVSGNNVVVEGYDIDGNGNYYTQAINKTTITGFIHIQDITNPGSTIPTNNVDMQTGVYTITPKCATDKSLDIANESPDNGANACIKKSDSVLGQSFAILGSASAYTLAPLCSDGKCLDVENNGSADGTNVRQWDANRTAAQSWTFRYAGDGYYYIRNANGKVLDVKDGSSKDGTNVRIYSFNGTDAQKWKIEPVRSTVTENRYTFSPRCADKYSLDIASASQKPGANAQIYATNGSAAQTFAVTVSDDTYLISPLSANNMSLDVKDNSSASGANVQQWTTYGGHAQQWTFQDAGDGYYYIRTANGLYLDVAGAKAQSTTNVDAYVFNGTDAQKWKLTEVTSNDIELTRVTVKDKVYTGSALKPVPEVSTIADKLVKGTDFTVSYKNNVNAGTAYVTVKGTGSYTGSKNASFTIEKANIAAAKAAAIKAKSYTGKPITPKPKLTYKGKTLKLGTDYTLSYKDNTNKGKATVTATGKGNFKGTKAMTFIIQ